MELNRYYVLNEDHTVRPIADHIEWAREFGDIRKRRVAITEWADVQVSTVFFRAGEDEDCQRWSTWDQAAEGHAAIVAALMEGRSASDAEDPR